MEILRLRSRTPLFHYSIGRPAGSCVAVLRADAVGRTSTGKGGSICRSDSTIPVFSPPVEPGREQEVLGLVLDHFLTKERCDVVSLSPLSGASLDHQCCASNLCKLTRTFSLARNDSLEPHTIFRLPQTFDHLLVIITKATTLKLHPRSCPSIQTIAHRPTMSLAARMPSIISMNLNGCTRPSGEPPNAWDILATGPKVSAFNTELVKNFAERKSSSVSRVDGQRRATVHPIWICVWRHLLLAFTCSKSQVGTGKVWPRPCWPCQNDRGSDC